MPNPVFPQNDDPSKPYYGPPIVQPQIDSHDPSQAIDSLKNTIQTLYQKYGPKAKDYIGQAFQGIGGAASNAAGAIGDAVNNNEFMQNVNKYVMNPSDKEDANISQEYQKMLGFAKSNADTASKVGVHVTKLYQFQLEIKKEFDRYISINNELKKFMTNENRFLVNDNSKSMYENLKDSFAKLESLFNSQKAEVAQATESMNGYKSMNQQNFQSISPVNFK